MEFARFVIAKFDVEAFVRVVLPEKVLLFARSVLLAAVTVPEEPREIGVPFTVTDEFASMVLVTVPVSVVYTPLVTEPAFPVMLIEAVPAAMFAAVRLVRFAPEMVPKEPLQVPEVMVPRVVNCGAEVVAYQSERLRRVEVEMSVEMVMFPLAAVVLRGYVALREVTAEVRYPALLPQKLALVVENARFWFCERKYEAEVVEKPKPNEEKYCAEVVEKK